LLIWIIMPADKPDADAGVGGVHGWPAGDAEFMAKYENLKKCQNILVKINKAHTTLGERGAVASLKRPKASVFDGRTSAPVTARDHWTHQTPRFGAQDLADEQAEGAAGIYLVSHHPPLWRTLKSALTSSKLGPPHCTSTDAASSLQTSGMRQG
jgi:hypothetical protein